MFYKVIRSATPSSLWTDFGSNYTIDARKFVQMVNRKHAYAGGAVILGATLPREFLRAVNEDKDWRAVLDALAVDSTVAQRPDGKHRLLLHLACANAFPLEAVRAVYSAYPIAQTVVAMDACTCGMNVEAESDNGWVPLQLAVARRADLDVVRFLAAEWDRTVPKWRKLDKLVDAKKRDLATIAAEYQADAAVLAFIAEATTEAASQK